MKSIGPVGYALNFCVVNVYCYEYFMHLESRTCSKFDINFIRFCIMQNMCYLFLSFFFCLMEAN